MQMVGVRLATVFNAEIVNEQRERCGARGTCFHSAGVCGTGAYLYAKRCLVSRSFATLLACLSPGIPFLTSMYTHPSFASL